MMTIRIYTILENNPEVLNTLAHSLGLSPNLSYHDVYSLTDPDLLAFIPRPVNAILAIIPMTPSWLQSRSEEDESYDTTTSHTSNNDTTKDHSPILWFPQTITNGCGTIGLLHTTLNNTSTTSNILPNTTLSTLHTQFTSPPIKTPSELAQIILESNDLYTAHESAAKLGDTPPPAVGDHAEHEGQHFVAFVKGDDGRLWELEGNRKGPMLRGVLEGEDDVLSPKGVELGIGRLIRMARGEGGDGKEDLRFSVLALAPTME